MTEFPGPNDRQAAMHCFQSGDFEGAARRLVSLLSRTAADPVLLRVCGMALVRSGKVDHGLPYLARSRRLAPDDPLGALWHGIALHVGGQFQEAASALERASSLMPNDPAPLIHLSRALLRLSHPLEAVEAARRAVVLAPSLPEAQQALGLSEISGLTAPGAPNDPATSADLARSWFRLGTACAELGKLIDARTAFEQGLSAHPDQADLSIALARFEHLCGEPVRAIARLDALLRRDPSDERARLALSRLKALDDEPGKALLLLDPPPHSDRLRPAWETQRIEALIGLGRRNEALAALGRVDPQGTENDLARNRQRLLLSRTSGDRRSFELLALRAEALALDPRAAIIEDRIAAHFTLADMHHADGAHARAFMQWERGHALLKMAQPFDRTTHSSLLETIIGCYGIDRLASGPRATLSDPCPVFIVGLPRTGTTLAEQILSAHPAVHGAGERLAIRETLRQLGGTNEMLQAVARTAALDEPALSKAASIYLKALHALAPDASIILDKMPDNVMHLGLIATLLPGARIICCTRDLRDVGASIFQQRFLGSHPYAHDLADLGWYMAQHRNLLAHWRKTLGPQLMEVNHADWINDFDKTLRQVLKFIGLPYNASCTRFFEQNRPVKTASRQQVRQPINAKGVGRWRAYTDLLAPMLRELGS